MYEIIIMYNEEVGETIEIPKRLQTRIRKLLREERFRLDLNNLKKDIEVEIMEFDD